MFLEDMVIFCFYSFIVCKKSRLFARTNGTESIENAIINNEYIATRERFTVLVIHTIAHALPNAPPERLPTGFRIHLPL